MSDSFDPMDCSPPGSAVHGILQAGILEWVAMPSSRESSRPRDGTLVSYASCIEGGFVSTSATHLCAYIQRLILSDWLTEVGKSYTCRVGWQPGDPKRADVTVRIQSLLLQLPPAHRRMVFHSIQVFSCLDKAQPHNHSGEQLALLHVHSLKCESHPKIPHRNTQNDIRPHIWAPWPCQVHALKSPVQGTNPLPHFFVLPDVLNVFKM